MLNKTLNQQMKKKYPYINSNQILYKTEELLDAASNRYKITIQVANRAKRRRYEDIDILDDLKIQPILRARLEMGDDIRQPESMSD
jgi:DNA-directed RNA polymerase subunit omega